MEGWVGDVALEAGCVDCGRLGWRGDQPLEELAMMLSLVGSCFLGVRPEWDVDGGLYIPAEKLLLFLALLVLAARVD